MEQQSRLSLKRNRCQTHVTNNIPVEISDDESSDSMSNPQSNIEQENCTNANHGMAYIPNNATDSSNPVHSLTNIHDLSDDLSSDEDVVIDIPETSKNTKSMFNWKNTNFPYAPRYQNSTSSINILHDSRFGKEMPKEVSNKKQKLMFDSTSSNNDDLASLNKEEALPSEVMIQHSLMIAGTKVTLPVKPYSCQIAVMNSVSTIIM